MSTKEKELPPNLGQQGEAHQMAKEPGALIGAGAPLATQEREYVVLNTFSTYVEGKKVYYRRGQIIPESVTSLWLNFQALIGTYITERIGRRAST